MLKDVIVRALDEGFLETRPLAILAYCHETPNLSVRDISAGLGLPKPATTRALDGIERRGLISRETSREDRRLVSIKVTSRGKALLARIGGEDA